MRGIHRSPVNSPHKGQWRGALMFSLICVWINVWINSRKAGDLRRCRAHYDVIIIRYMLPSVCLKLRPFSQFLSFNIWGCVLSAYPIIPWWSWECVFCRIVIIKSDVWIINHCLGLGRETMVCGVYLIMFLWYYTQHCNNGDRAYIRICTHKRHPTPRPLGWAMGNLLWGLREKLFR